MAFKPTRPLGGKNNEILPKAAALVTTKGQLLQLSVTTGLLESAGVATTTNVLWIANSTIAAADALTEVEGVQVQIGADEYLVNTVNNSDAAHNGQRMIITAGGLTLTNTGTDVATAPFQQIAVVGAAADKLIRARRVQ